VVSVGSRAKHDVTVYSPFSGSLFRQSLQRAGGAERQMALLAGELARRAHSVALVVYEVPDPVPGIDPRLTLIGRSSHAGSTVVGNLRESARVLRSLVAANGRVVVVRTGTPVVGFIALYTRLRRRRLVFSSANNFDFLPRTKPSRLQTWLYRFGVRRADAVVVQSLEQVELARKAFPRIRNLVHIPSFADDPAPSGEPQDPTAFVWAGRLVDYKRPLLYADLAAAVPEAQFILIPHIPSQLDREQKDFLAELERAVERTPNLELGAPLPHAKLIEGLASAVAVVNTSSFEGMPNTFLEAWGQGVPVLTLSFDPDGVVERLGLGVSANDSWDAFVAGARDLWQSRFDRAELSERVQSHVRATHSKQAVGLKWHEVLERLGAFEAG
jgi:glycosyltransferase involved in cell wall biosynthesis